MSGAILYAAIVAIWALVLVPRWLRPRHPAPRTLESHLTEPAGLRRPEDFALAGQDAAGRDGAGQEAAAQDGDAGSPTRTDHMRAESGTSQPGDSPGRPGDDGPSAAGRQAGILRSRRWALITLLLLTAGAVGIAVTHIAADWVVIPPGGMLAGYILLLREAARSDARRARTITARQPAATVAAGRVAQAGAAGDVPAGDVAMEPGAQIIDISARVGDQLYDQYADAVDRAVGD